MKATTSFGTVLTAMVTPFTSDGSRVDLDAVATLANELVDLGNNGLVVNGTTGESPTTDEHEKLEILKVVVETVGNRAKVIAGAGSNDTAHSVLLAKDAVKAGADGLLVVTPYYNKPPQAGVIAHMHAVADATDLPVMLYDIPGRAGIPITTESLLTLAQHPRILANKDAKGDVFAASEVMAKSDLAYYSGDDGLNLALLAVGAVGVVSVTGHVVADRHKAMVEAVAANDLATARTINQGLVPITEGIMTKAGGAIMVKAALDLLGRTGGGALRLPLVSATPAQREQLRTDLRAGGFSL
ncbi:MAG: 4-hydroxy-tetrahydrodipicolinate synthase [Actinobacteria bacterium]|uniref:4-hydroxy-tetrahydrodipicolinate synthase n=1 Tax=freshwater metagenome TaxID=449393 RepID=A0A6J5ZEU0_9ZZZZ|nr:4-hydroxy-tetrahydrodipicolinate synthase [Actinomycetota bacterium]